MANTFDFAPLFRSAVGFDRMAEALKAAGQVEESALAYPPYNIEVVDDDHYRIEMAVTGLKREDLEVLLQQGTLTVKTKAAPDKYHDKKYLYHGIQTRGFERRFNLAEHIKVTGANLEDGVLFVDLERRLPEELRARTIDIEAGPAQKVIESKAA
jgi:molecular chaperone IbpA